MKKRVNERTTMVEKFGGGIVKCDLCGTNVKIVGHTTMHYEPVVDRDYIVCELHNIDFVTYQEGRKSLALLKHQIADAIISAMYGTVDNVETVKTINE